MFPKVASTIRFIGRHHEVVCDKLAAAVYFGFPVYMVACKYHNANQETALERYRRERVR